MDVAFSQQKRIKILAEGAYEGSERQGITSKKPEENHTAAINAKQ